MDFNKHIPEIEKIISYKFKDKSLLTQAFTRSSYCNEKRTAAERYYSNEVLEFFGDSVLSTAIVSIFLESKTERCPHGIATELGEGDFSVIRSKLSDKRNLSLATEKLGIQKYLIMGEGDVKLGIENEPSVMEDLFESIVGAIYVDCGMNMDTVIKSVKVMLDLSHYSATTTSASPSAKNALQEWCADKRRRLPPPRYETLSEEGPDHKKIYERACYIGDRLCGTGKGKNCKIADTLAAEAALNTLISEESEAQKPRISPEEILPALQSLARKNKVATAQFKDLGESENSTSYSPEFIVECKFMGKSGIGKGKSKLEARAAAAHEVLVMLGERKQNIKTNGHKTETEKTDNQKRKGNTHTIDKSVKNTSPTATDGESTEPKTKPKPAPRVKKTTKNPKKDDTQNNQAAPTATENAKTQINAAKPKAKNKSKAQDDSATAAQSKSAAAQLNAAKPKAKNKSKAQDESTTAAQSKATVAQLNVAKPQTKNKSMAQDESARAAQSKATVAHIKSEANTQDKTAQISDSEAAKSPKNATRPRTFRKNRRKPVKSK